MSRCNLKLNSSKAAGRCFILLGIIFSQSTHTFACGPNFPNEMLDRGDDAVLAAPIADFDRELERIHLLPANFHAVLTTNDYASQTIDAGLADLRAALRKTEMTKAERERIISNYQVARVQLASLHNAQVKVDDGVFTTESVPEQKPSEPIPSAPPNISVPDGLPDEFAEYFRGSIEWHADRTNEARVIWETLLERPDTERHYRSTWAAYMLGKYWQGVDEEKSIEYFQKVRSLTAAGFADRLGLAAASLGWEAHEELHREHFDRAIQLYLQQLASGDDSATASLRMAAGQALGEGSQLTSLATNTECRRVITAYIFT
jgi:tetratricopeptide (TPR) repeat protein